MLDWRGPGSSFESSTVPALLFNDRNEIERLRDRKANTDAEQVDRRHLPTGQVMPGNFKGLPFGIEMHSAD